MNVIRRPIRGRLAAQLRRVTTRSVVLAAAVAVSLPAVGVVTASQAAAAPGDDVIGWVEVEDGVISGGAAGLPALNSGDHGNFSGSGSYTFRETGMMSTMSVTAPQAGVYPVYVRYAAGPLSAAENITRSMGLLTNGGARQLMSLPMTSFADWESWGYVKYDVTLNQGANTVAIQCDRGTDFCRLNFDAIQVGGTTFDPCPAIAPKPGHTSLFDGTFATFEGWRKAAAGGFGRTTDCAIRSFRGRGATWVTTQRANGPYTLELDWRRGTAADDSSVHLASSSRGGADPVGGYSIPIGADTGAIVPTGGATKSADQTAVQAAVRPLGQWNTYRIELTSTRLKVYLNDVLVNTLATSSTSTAGHIGLENRSSADRVDFKNIQVRGDVDLGSIAGQFGRATLADGTTVNPGAESTLGNLVAESHRWATEGSATGDAQIAFVHPDALAADLQGAGYPARITQSQAAAAHPGAEALVNMRLTGAQLKTVLEQQWQRTAGGAVPARPFLRLGISSGFTYTYDPTKDEGSRITGMKLDGDTVIPEIAYSVTVNSHLAAGGDNFRAFVDGTSRLTTPKRGLAALADYLADGPGARPLAPSFTQRSVGISFPGGAKASYVAGEAFDVDLSSLAFSRAADQVDTAVQVSIGTRPLGTYPVDNAIGAALTDEHGRAAVRATLPADLAAGPATVRIVGNTTGTTVNLPIVVSAKAASTTAITVAPAQIQVDGAPSTVTVTVASPGATPSGDVEVLVDGAKVATATLANGTVTVPVGPFATVGTRSVQARYLGNATTSPSSSANASITVSKASSATAVTVSPSSVAIKQGKASVAVTVTSQGATPTGTAEVLVNGVRVTTVTLVNGRATASVGPFAKAGSTSIVARYLGSATTNPSTSAAATVRVNKAAAKVRVTLAPKKVVATKTRVRATIRVTAPGVTATGKVRLKVGAKTYTGTLRNGRVILTLVRFKKPGAVAVTVTYLGDASTSTASARTKVRVVRAPKR